MTVVCFKQATALKFWLERTERRWVVVTLGIRRCAQNDGKNLQRQKQRQKQQRRRRHYGWDERVHPIHR
jgi:hypothetical protein